MFTDRYFPGQAKQSFVSLPRKELTSIEGVYQSTRREDSTRLKLLSLLPAKGGQVDKKGALHLSNIKDLRDHPSSGSRSAKIFGRRWTARGEYLPFATRRIRSFVLHMIFLEFNRSGFPWYEHKGPVLTAVVASPARSVGSGPSPRWCAKPGECSWATDHAVTTARHALVAGTTQVAALVWIILFAVRGHRSE